MIANGEEWEQFVPKKVAEIIKKVNGEKRIKVISKTETKPTEYWYEKTSSLPNLSYMWV